MSPTVTTFRDVMSRFPSGVVVVTTRSGHHDYAMTASSFTSVSLDPLLVLICVAQESRFHAALKRTGAWAVNVLSEDSGGRADWFARNGRPMAPGKSPEAMIRRGSSGIVLLRDAVAHLECRTSQIHTAGDHDIVVGAVTAARVVSQDLPLVYWQSKYHQGLTRTEPWPPHAQQRATDVGGELTAT